MHSEIFELFKYTLGLKLLKITPPHLLFILLYYFFVQCLRNEKKFLIFGQSVSYSSAGQRKPLKHVGSPRSECTKRK